MDKWRQKLHTEPPEGWLNDPNGLIYFNGMYHVFFQYSPGSPEGKTLRCWGHYEGKDLFKMRYTGIVLSPDIPEDRDGVYSGSAAEKDGLMHIFYTGNVKEKGDYNYITNGRGANVIHVTSPDGVNMSGKSVVLRNSDYPGFCSCHVRDPKVWKDGIRWKMVLGARTADDKGCVLVYSSPDLEKWEYAASVSLPGMGYMWECPDYFEKEGRGYLSVSPQGLDHYEDKYQNIFQSGYFSVNGSLEQGSLQSFTEWDHGFDFYAPQTFEDSSGRRILIGWAGLDDKNYRNPTVPLGWQHCLTLPREITADVKGKLLQNPVQEINNFFGNNENLCCGREYETPLPFDLFMLTDGDFEVSFDGKMHISYDTAKELYTLRFTDEKYGGGRTVRKLRTGKHQDMRIIADMSSAEIYINGGEHVMTTRFYPESEKISLKINGSASAVIKRLMEV